VVNLFLGNAFLTKLGCDDSLRDLLMLMARCSPSKCELLIIDEASFLQTIDSCLRNLIIDASGFEVSEQLPLTLCTGN
jgi:hypothetical protein